MQQVKLWLKALEKEASEIDLWEELGSTELGGEIAGHEDVTNTPFTEEEQKAIARQLEETKAYIRRTYELSEAQFRDLESRLNYLTEAARCLPRLDWRNALLGVLLGTVVQGLLPPEPVRDVIQMILRGLATVFGHELPQLPQAL
jgi:hypothetical protein